MNRICSHRSPACRSVLNSSRDLGARTLAALMLVAGWLTVLSNSATAVNVTNYSWLQLPDANVTTVLGSTNNATGSVFGEPADFRWGDYTWIPSAAMTNSGAQMYYAGVRLDQPRQISNVRLEWFTTTTVDLSRYYIDSSNDGSSWSNIATVVPGSTPPINSINTVPVTPGNYQYVRVRFEPGDYTAGAYPGPGLTLIEPFGSGTVSSDKVNWANGPNFGTTITNFGTTPLGLNNYNGTAHNSGSLQDQAGTAFWTGSIGNWPAGEYTQIDLGAKRLLNSATAAWGTPYTGNAFNVQYSTDGINFFPVPNPQAPTQFAIATYSSGGTRVQFDPTIARYIRMSDAVNSGGGFTLMNQFLLHGPTDGVLATDPFANDTIDVVFRTLPQTVTLTGAVELENTGTAGTYVGILSYSITGPDASQFSLTNFTPTILGGGGSVLFDLQFMSLAAQSYNALLTFNTSLGDIMFNLQATMVPEPSTFALLGLGVVGLAVKSRLRRRAAA